LQVSIKTALETRKTALKTAWSTTDATQRKSAIKAAWAQFKTEAKACKATSTNEIQGNDVQF